MSQGARFKVSGPVTNQAVVQMLDVLYVVTEALKCEESVKEANSIEEVHEIVKEFQESPQ